MGYSESVSIPESIIVTSSASISSSVPDFTTSILTTPISVCKELVELTTSGLIKPFIGTYNIHPEVTGGNFDFSVPSGIGVVSIQVQLPLGGTLMSLNLIGTYISYQVFTVDKDGVQSTPVLNTIGKDVFNGQNHFNAYVGNQNYLMITIAGPNEGFSVNITEFNICPPDIDFCYLGTEEILDALSFLPLNYTLGLSDQNVTIYYGYNGDYIEQGVVVTGTCYSCICSDRKLVCTVENCTECPNAITECQGDCYSAFEVKIFSEVGVPDHCLNSSKPCVPDECSTTHICPDPWSPWSPCTTNCQQFRTRTCGPECQDECNNFNLTETQTCDQCVQVTTSPICEETEELKCVTNYDECIKSCAVYRKNSTCDALKDDESCVDKCECKDGYFRNAFGECVLQAECECYESSQSSTPIPPSVNINISKCVKCECFSDGYTCTEVDDCCELKEWSDWSECSTTCGEGKRTRQRQIYGNGCPDVEAKTETQECQLSECPCIYNGEVWEPGKVVRNRCEECSCHDGVVTCNKFDNIGNQTWSNPECDQICFCNENNTEECKHSDKLQKCQEVIKQCNQTTHVLEDTEDSCCKKCVPKMIPCSYKVETTTILNVTVEGHGLCVSPELEVGSCFGSCDFSSDNIVNTQLVNDTFELFTEQNCSCCKASIDKKVVPFLCEKDKFIVNYKVSYISGCSCDRCQ
uniref:CTCK domain-containing protein n=1 Tax=Biomphalaria glabrata TaxID=6526 RepID=A0A2C9JSD4_BIOGL